MASFNERTGRGLGESLETFADDGAFVGGASMGEEELTRAEGAGVDATLGVEDGTAFVPLGVEPLPCARASIADSSALAINT
jgi:hypothetical protein